MPYKNAIVLIVLEPSEIYLDFLTAFAQGPTIGTAFAQYDIYIIIDVDMVCTSDINLLVERIESNNAESISVCKDSHTEGLSFGDLIVSSWSAYKGNKNCKHILNLNESELKSQLIINSGLIAGKKKAILSIEDQIKRLSPISL